MEVVDRLIAVQVDVIEQGEGFYFGSGSRRSYREAGMRAVSKIGSTSRGQADLCDMRSNLGAGTGYLWRPIVTGPLSMPSLPLCHIAAAERSKEVSTSPEGVSWQPVTDS